MKVLVINGPNMEKLGSRDKRYYGRLTLKKLEELLKNVGKKIGIEVDCYQSNLEGEIVDAINKSSKYGAIIINPAGYTHTSVAIRDAIEACDKPVIEVHMSNILSRENFRRVSITSEKATGVICGFGEVSYIIALYVIKELYDRIK
ncbi:MAG: type II 3-dehydroquinate dehydratase [bacterium]|nr:type II 3-dehydroquinate dehydratase [bacterium]